MSDVQTQVLALTKLKPKADETAEDFTMRAVKKLHGSTDQEWEALPDPVQAWVNDNMVANEAGTPLELLELPEAESKEDEQEVEAEAEPEEEAGAEVNEGEQESVVEVKSAKKANGKKPAAKKAAAPKKVAAKKAGGETRGRKPNIGPPDAVIKILKAETPFRKGTIRQKVFDKYKPGMTVAAANKAGVPYSHMQWHAAHGLIAVK